METTSTAHWFVVNSTPTSSQFIPSYWNFLHACGATSVRVIPLKSSFILEIHASGAVGEVLKDVREEPDFKSLLQYLSNEDVSFLLAEYKVKDLSAFIKKVEGAFKKVDSYLPSIHFVFSNGRFYEKTCKLPNLASIYAQPNAAEGLYVPWIECISSEWAWSLAWLEDQNCKHISLPCALPLAIRSVWNSLSIGNLSAKVEDITNLEGLASTYGLTFKVSRVCKTPLAHAILYEDSIGTGEYIIRLLRFSNDLFASYTEGFIQFPSILDIENTWKEFQTTLEQLSKHQLYKSTLENSVKKFADELEKTKRLPLKRVAIIGKTKSGKSTLINSILGCQILPEANKHQTQTTTKVPTFIHYADRADYVITFDTFDIDATVAKMKSLSMEEELEKADKVYFTDLLQADEPLEEEQLHEALRVIGNSEETDDYTIKCAVDRWNELKSKAAELKQDHPAETEAILASKLQEFCTNTDLSFVVKAIHVHGRFPHIQGIEIVDMPGFEDTSENINIQTSTVLEQANLEHIFYLFPSDIQKDNQATERIKSYRGQKDIDTTILLRPTSGAQVSEYPKLTFQFIEPWKAVMRKEVKINMNYGSVDAKLANASLHDSDYEKLGINQIRRVLKMISHSALLELASRFSHLVDRATELFLQAGDSQVDTTIFDKLMGECNTQIQHQLNLIPVNLQLSQHLTQELEKHIKQHLAKLCATLHGSTLRAVLAKASYDGVHISRSGFSKEYFYTIDELMKPFTSALEKASNQLQNDNQNYEQLVQDQLKQLCSKVSMPHREITSFTARHLRTVAKFFHFRVNLGLVRDSLIATLQNLLLHMAQVYQGSKKVGEAANAILYAEFPSLAGVTSVAENAWKTNIDECVGSLKSEIAMLEQEVRLAFISSKAKEMEHQQLERIRNSLHLTSTLRIPQIVTASEVSNMVATIKDKPVLLHVGAFNKLELNLTRVGHLLAKTKFLHLENPESASYFDLYINGECYNSFIPIALEEALQAFFSYQQRDHIQNLPTLRPQGDPLGEGSYGQVFKVAYGNQLFAIKKIQSSKPEQQFEQEKVALIKLTHPRIIPLLAYNADDHCLVMPWMAGGDLHKLIMRKQTLPTNFVMKLAYQIADGLLYLHSQRWMHRDLKSSNILLTTDDDSANCVISDFGSAKLYEEGTKNTLKVGTNPYMAPEVANEEYALPADIYSFGAVLVELIACKVLVSEHSISEFLSDPIVQAHPIYFLAKQCCERDASARPTAKEVFDMISGFAIRSIPGFAGNNDFTYICTWVRHRVLHSKTQYPIRSPNSGTQLLNSFRVAVMLQYLESDVERIWNEDQRRLIAHGLRNQTYCRDLNAKQKSELQKDLTLDATHCIYFYCNELGDCYVGKTDRSLRTRHSEHVKKAHSNFDRRMKTEDWHNIQPIPICTYEDYSQMTRYEVLHVLVFNTARVHDERGLNTMLGGDFGASNVLMKEEAELADMMGKVSIK